MEYFQTVINIVSVVSHKQLSHKHEIILSYYTAGLFSSMPLLIILN